MGKYGCFKEENYPVHIFLTALHYIYPNICYKICTSRSTILLSASKATLMKDPCISLKIEYIDLLWISWNSYLCLFSLMAFFTETCEFIWFFVITKGCKYYDKCFSSIFTFVLNDYYCDLWHNGGFHLVDLIIMELKSHMTC